MLKSMLLLIIVGLTTTAFSFAGVVGQPIENNMFLGLLHKAEQGSVQSQFELAQCYEYGSCTDQNDKQAIYWYQKASEQQYVEATYRVGVFFDNGWGVNEDDHKASTYYQSAAIDNHSLAQHDIAIMYMNGTGVEKNYAKAYMWLSIAVIRGNDMMKGQLQRLKNLMTSEEITDAKNMASEFFITQ